jgi:mycothiol synthase
MNNAQAITTRSYRPENEPAVIDLWNRCLVRDTVTPQVFRRKVLLDPHFDPAGFRLAWHDAELIGGCLAMGRAGLGGTTGWLRMIFVHPAWRRRGVGSRLLGEALEYLRGAGKTQVQVAVGPNYFIPGVDLHAYAAAVAFFEAHGFVRGGESISMDASLVQYELPAEARQIEARLRAEGITVKLFEPDEILPLLEFLERAFPHWVEPARELLVWCTYGWADYDQFLIARDAEGKVIGYCQYDGEHFGPFGVDPAEQGRGIGTVLLARCLERMRARGYHSAWFMWTGERAARLYRRFGFVETRRYVSMRRTL